MALNLSQITSLRINEGTQETPFILSDQEVATIYKLSQSGNEDISIEGVVNTTTGQISRSYAYSIKKAFPRLTILAEEVTDTSWSVMLGRTSVNEGESAAIVALNIDLSALSCEIDTVAVNVTSGSMTETGVRAALTIDMDSAKITVAKSSSNASWVASVRFKFYPKFQEGVLTDADYRYATLAISAVGITGITTDLPNEIGLRDTITPFKVTCLPESNTKSSLVAFDATTGTGSVIPASWTDGETAYYSHAGSEGEDDITVRCKVGTNIIAYTTKTVAIGQAKIFFHITHDSTLSADLAVVKVTKPDGSIVTVKDGDTIEVAGNGTETYTLSTETFKGFNITYPKTVVPTSIKTDVNIDFAVIQPDVYLVYSDGSLETYDVVAARNFTAAVGKNPVGVGIQTADCSFMIAGREETQTSMQWRTSNTLVPELPQLENNDIVLRQFNGWDNTQILIQYADCTAANYCYGKTITIAGEERHGYLGSIGELKVYATNNAKMNKLMNTVFACNGVNIHSGYWWSSAQRSSNHAWYLNTGNLNYNGKTLYYNVRPFYAF